MTYTLLFTDNCGRTAGIVVIDYNRGDTSPAILRHAHYVREYQCAYLLGENGFEGKPFYERRLGEVDWEVSYALAVLQERINDTPAKGGLAYGRDAQHAVAQERKTVWLKSECGHRLENVVTEMIAKATKEKVKVWRLFNGVRLEATEASQPGEIIERYHGRQKKKWRAEAKLKVARLARRLKKVDFRSPAFTIWLADVLAYAKHVCERSSEA